jgi:glycosyltransferase involved in cell wall biosynthesis
MAGKRYRVDLVVADRGWILEKIADAIVHSAEREENPRFEVCILDAPSGDADLTYFLPYSIQEPVARGLVGSYFAHQEEVPAAKERFLAMAAEADFCIVKAERYETLLRQRGVARVRKIITGVDLDAFKPKIRIGVIGRVYPNTGRKGEHLLASVAGLENVELVFAGHGWPYPGRYYNETELPDFYHGIDYLLIPSLIEGGPVPVQEALACGKPVIAPDVGFVGEYPHIPFDTGDADDLLRVVKRLVDERLALRRSVLGNSWRACGDAYLQAFWDFLEEGDEDAVAEPAGPRDDRLRISLLVHGGELSRSKGGPSIRSAQIRDELIRHGHEAEIHGSIEEARRYAPDLVHVFNSWPLDSADEAASAAAGLGLPLVFSPIALNLGGREIFDDLVCDILAEAPEEEMDRELLRMSRNISLAMGVDGRAASPAEGVEGHFAALARVAGLSDRVVTLSEAEEAVLDAAGVDAAKMERIPNGADVEHMAAGDPDAFKQAFGLGDYVLCVGRIEPRKNQAVVARALKPLGIPLVLVGHSGNERYLQLVRACGNEKLTWVDRVDDRELLASAYRGAAAFVLMSWCEGASLSAIEAGAAGTPLILSSLSSELEYFGEFARVLDPGDVEGIRQAVIDELKTPEGPDRRKARSSYVCQRYSMQRHVSDTLKVYETTLAGRHGSSAGEGAAKPRHFLDISKAYASSRFGLEVTGAAAVEFGVIEAALGAGHESFVVWDRDNRMFFPVTLRPGDRESIREQLSRVDPKNATATSIRPKAFKQIGNPAFKQKYARKIRKIVNQTIFGVLDRLPRPLSKPLHGVLKRWNKHKKARRAKSSAEIRHGRASRGVGSRSGTELPRYQIGYRMERSNWRFRTGDKLTVIGHTWQYDVDYLEALLAIRRGTDLDLGVIIHDLAFFQAPSTLYTSKDRAELQSRARDIVYAASRVYTTSREVERHLLEMRDLDRSDYRVRRIRLGDTDTTTNGKPVKGLKPNRFVLFVSSFHPRKNQELLLEVWASLQSQLRDAGLGDVELVLAGAFQRGSEDYSDAVHSRNLARYGVRILESVGDPQIAWLYRHCLLTLYPSVYEGWGLPVLESLQYGKVCLVSDKVPAAKEIVNGAIIPVDPYDFFGWRKTLRAFLINPRMRSAFEAEARRYRPVGYAGMTADLLDD